MSVHLHEVSHDKEIIISEHVLGIPLRDIKKPLYGNAVKLGRTGATVNRARDSQPRTRQSTAHAPGSHASNPPGNMYTPDRFTIFKCRHTRATFMKASYFF